MLKAECPIWSTLTRYWEYKERPLALALASMTGKSFRGCVWRGPLGKGVGGCVRSCRSTVAGGSLDLGRRLARAGWGQASGLLTILTVPSSSLPGLLASFVYITVISENIINPSVFQAYTCSLEPCS